MDQNIVREFQNLNVLSAFDSARMDELVQDLTNALEETAQRSQGDHSATYSSLRRAAYKKRRIRKRRSNPSLGDGGNISEASESSIDEALKDYMENLLAPSDSDDLVLGSRRLHVPGLGSISLSLAESDSVTENFSPMRPHRRRRKGKRMAIDPEPDLDNSDKPQLCRSRPKRDRMPSKVRTLEAQNDNVMDIGELAEQGVQPVATSSSTSECTMPGKRKRADSQPRHADANHSAEAGSGPTKVHESSCSSLSSSESDCGGIFTNDEGRDGDDEQSDFFHEPGPACGVAGIIPWWEQEKEEDMIQKEANFEKILTGSFDIMTPSSKRSFKARVSKLLTRNREIRAARRTHKERRIAYPLPRYHAEPSTSMFGAWQSPPNHSSDSKRRRKTPPSSPSNEGFYVGENADPISEANIGNRMLQNMGWNPGSGLGSEGHGITTPVMAYVRPKRKGLGNSSNS